MSVNNISNPYVYNEKVASDTLSHEEWNALSQAAAIAQEKINDIINQGVPSSGGESGGGSSSPIDTSGVISVSNKGNVTLGSQKNINLEPAWDNKNPQGYTGNYGDIALKSGDDIQFCSHHREPKKRDKVVLKNIDGSDNPVKFQIVAGEIDFADQGNYGGEASIELLDFAQENRGIFEGKVVHLGSCSTFKTDEEQILKFKSLSKALMVTGYQKDVEMTESFIFEAWLLNSLYKHPDYRAKRLMDLANKEMKFFVDRYGFIAF